MQTIIQETKNEAFEAFLHTAIKQFNDRTSPHHKTARAPDYIKKLSLIVQDEAGNFLGGLTASIYWEWLEVDDFYLPDILRGRGLGTKLLRQTEEIAVQRGCKRAFLSTFSFQARGFYELQGYRVVGELVDYPPGSAFYWMRKELGKNEESFSRDPLDSSLTLSHNDPADRNITT